VFFTDGVTITSDIFKTLFGVFFGEVVAAKPKIEHFQWSDQLQISRII